MAVENSDFECSSLRIARFYQQESANVKAKNYCVVNDLGDAPAATLTAAQQVCLIDVSLVIWLELHVFSVSQILSQMLFRYPWCTICV